MSLITVDYGNIGGGGIDLLNPDSYSGENVAQISISPNSSYTVTLSDTPRYGIIDMSFNSTSSTTYFYLIDFTNQTAKLAGFENNYIVLHDVTFSTIIPTFSGNSVAIKNQSGAKTCFTTFLAYY